MTTFAMKSEGLAFAIGDGNSPEVFTTIGEVATMDGPGGQAAVIDATHFGSTAKEKLMGLPDEGQVTLGGNFIGQNSPSGTSQIALRTARSNQSATNFKITFTDSPATIATFTAFVLGFSVSAGVDDKISYSCTLEVTGSVTYSGGTA